MLGSARHDVDCAARLLPGENATVVLPAQVLIAVGSLRNSDGSGSLHSGVHSVWHAGCILPFKVQRGPARRHRTMPKAKAAGPGTRPRMNRRKPGSGGLSLSVRPQNPKQSTVWNNSKLLISWRDLSTTFDKVDPLAHIRLVSPADQGPFAAHAMRDGNRSAIMAVC